MHSPFKEELSLWRLENDWLLKGIILLVELQQILIIDQSLSLSDNDIQIVWIFAIYFTESQSLSGTGNFRCVASIKQTSYIILVPNKCKLILILFIKTFKVSQYVSSKLAIEWGIGGCHIVMLNISKKVPKIEGRHTRKQKH